MRSSEIAEPICFRDDITIKIDEGGVCFTVSSRDYKGAICIVQNTTGTLSPGAHPGSYNGQDVYNDLLVCGKWATASGSASADGGCAELYARSANNFEGGV